MPYFLSLLSTILQAQSGLQSWNFTCPVRILQVSDIGLVLSFEDCIDHLNLWNSLHILSLPYMLWNTFCTRHLNIQFTYFFYSSSLLLKRDNILGGLGAEFFNSSRTLAVFIRNSKGTCSKFQAVNGVCTNCRRVATANVHVVKQIAVMSKSARPTDLTDKFHSEWQLIFLLHIFYCSEW